MDVVDLLRQTPNGVATWKQLKPFVTEKDLIAAIRSRLVKRDGRGIYRLAAAADHYGVAARLRGTLSHLSAARHHGLTLFHDPDKVYVTLPTTRSRVKPPGDARLFYRRLPADRVVDGATDIIQTVLDCARDCPVPDALAVADSALRHRKIYRDELLEAAAELRNRQSARARRIVEWADARAASVMESALRGILYEAGFTCFEPQFPVQISTGRILHADLGHAASHVVIEADSLLNHGTASRLEIDTHRYDEFAAAGYTVLRFTWRQITTEPAWVIEMVRATLRRKGWA